jgi:nitroreductase
MNHTLELLLNHSSVRDFKETTINRNIINIIIKTAQMAPTSSHYQAYTIIGVEDVMKKHLLSDIAGGQSWVKEAPLVLLFCGDLYRANKYYRNIDSKVLSNTELYTVATTDASLAAQNAFIAAKSLGLDGVFVGGIRNNVELVSKEFKLPDLVFPLFLLCLGFSKDEIKTKIKPRLPQAVIHKSNFYNSQNDDELIKLYDMKVKEYYKDRTSGKIKDKWTERCGKSLMEKTRYEVGKFFRSIELFKS